MGRQATTMKRLNFYITEKQEKSLKKESEKIGITLSELFRRIFDDHIGKKNNDSQ